MRQLCLAIASIITALPCFALNTYFCNANHQYINLGDTADKVQLACGKPDVILPYKPGQNNNNGPQVWTYQAVINPMAMPLNTNGYYSTPNNPLRNGLSNPNPFGSNNSNYNSANIPTFTVTIANGVVTAVEGQNRNCGNWNPYVGVSSQAVLAHCGQPFGVNDAINDPYNHKIETWVYNNPYGPALKLKMIDNKIANMDLAATN